MKLAVLLVFLAAVMIPMSAYAESQAEFGVRQLPEKLLEYTEGTLQVFVSTNDLMIPGVITGLKTTSTDSSIIKIIGIDSSNEYIINIQLQALQPGDAKIILAAPGFTSKEIPVRVFNNNNFPTQIQMKVTPNDFPVDGPRNGYIGIELLTTSGLPTKAEKDTLIKFSTPNTDMIKLKEHEVLIKKGEYFAINEFEVLSSGEPIIFAETEDMKRISEFITIKESAEPYKIKVYAYPETFTSYSNPTAYLIIQLQDNDGIPVISEDDIHVTITPQNPKASIHLTKNFDEVLFESDELVIENGSYWAATSFTVRPDLGDFTESDFQQYLISAAADDYISSQTRITVIHERIGDGFDSLLSDVDVGQVKGGILLGEGPAFFSDLPFLTTGKNELIGVVYLEATVPIIETLDYLASGSTTVFASIADEVTIPVMTKNDLELSIASSHLNTVDFVNPILNKGANSALVFGNTGTVAPKDCSIEYYLTDNEGISTIEGEPYGPVRDSITLTVEPIIPKILAGTEFPVIGFLMESDGTSDSDEESSDEGSSEDSSCYESSSSSEEEGEEEESGRFGVTYFTDETVLTFSADEYAEIEPAIIKQNQPFALMTAKSNKVGSTSLEVRGTDLTSSISIESHTTDPTTFALTYPISTLPYSNALLALQVLDSGGNPVYANEDINVELVSNNESVIGVPENLVISKDDYRTIFEINTKVEGISEIALLSEDLPLAKYDFLVRGISPELNMDFSGSGLINEKMKATVSISYPGVNLSGDGLSVEWVVSGADVINKQTKTDANGKATIELISHSPSTANIKAIVDGAGISNIEKVGTYSFESTGGNGEIVGSENSGLGGFGLGGSQLIYFIIPGALAGTFLFLKRTNRLEGISERLPGGLGEKFDDIKEKISDIRERD